MSNESVGSSPVTDSPVDVHEEQAKKEAKAKADKEANSQKDAKAEAEKAVRDKVVEAVDQFGKIVRKTIGPPGTP